MSYLGWSRSYYCSTLCGWTSRCICNLVWVQRRCVFRRGWSSWHGFSMHILRNLSSIIIPCWTNIRRDALFCSYFFCITFYWKVISKLSCSELSSWKMIVGYCDMYEEWKLLIDYIPDSVLCSIISRRYLARLLYGSTSFSSAALRLLGIFLIILSSVLVEQEVVFVVFGECLLHTNLL